MNIARRTQVQNLREVWKKETDFSDWLVTEDGLAMLSEDLGITIENARRESRPGDFPCDIVGNLLGDETHIVVIENQYGRTDHDHLGKMLTYAAVHQALTGIWIAENVSDDHRTVIDWLNSNTPETVSFYLAELKAYRISNSPVAPQLDILSRPNYSIKARSNDISVGEQERRSWRKRFWEEIHSAIRESRPPFNLQRPGPDHWSSIAIGTSDIHIEMLLTPRNKAIGLQLIVKVRGWKEAAFQQLFDQRTEIEQELGATLDWRPMPENISARILLEAPIDPDAPVNRESVRKWFVEMTPKFFLAFRDRVSKLQQPTPS